MIVNIVFLIILFSGSFLGAVIFRKRADIILPITVMGYSMLLFLIGIVIDLKFGFYIIIFVSLCMYFISLLYIVRHKLYAKSNCWDIISCIITPGIVYFLLCSVVMALMSRGLVAHSWDEFSFWMDTVKAMTQNDDFITNPALNASLRTYPPLFSLFQYLMQKVYLLINPKYDFIEWRCYYAKQIFILAMMLPLFSTQRKMRKLDFVSAGVIAFFLPMVFDSQIYTTCYVDSFLAVVSGVGFFVVLKNSVEKNYNIENNIFVLLTISTIVLIKDAGILFAAFLSILYAVNCAMDTDIRKKRKFYIVMASIFAVIVPNLLWRYELYKWDITTNTTGGIKFSWADIVAIITGNDVSYKRNVFIGFFHRLNNTVINGSAFSLSYIGLLICGFTILIYVLHQWVKDKKIKTYQGIFDGVMIGILSFFYIFGLFITYVTNFSEYEAVRLASYERYQVIFFLAFVIIDISCLWILSSDKRNYYNLVVLIGILLCIPYQTLFNDTVRVTKQEAISFRAPYIELTNMIEANCEKDDKVWVISEGDTGLDKWVIRYNVRPVRINDSWGAWSLGEPQYDGDVWTIPKTTEEWKEELMGDYDFVALYKVNDYFKKIYGGGVRQPRGYN